jgi:hypothetical protein
MKNLYKYIVLSIIALIVIYANNAKSADYAKKQFEDTVIANVQTLQDTVDVIEARALAIDNNLHRKQYTIGRKAVPTATSFADTSANCFYPFNLTAGADTTFGTAVQILGTDDTPIKAGMSNFIITQTTVISVDDNTIYKMRVLWGASVAEALALNQYTENWVYGDSANPQQASPNPVPINSVRISAGTNVWLQIANATESRP